MTILNQTVPYWGRHWKKQIAEWTPYSNIDVFVNLRKFLLIPSTIIFIFFSLCVAHRKSCNRMYSYIDDQISLFIHFSKSWHLCYHTIYVNCRPFPLPPLHPPASVVVVVMIIVWLCLSLRLNSSSISVDFLMQPFFRESVLLGKKGKKNRHKALRRVSQ